MNLPQTPRFALPLLAAGQAHKELFHNEALTLIDFLVHPVVVGIENDPAALSPSKGECWIIGTEPIGGWDGRDNTIACWTEGGWRFAKPAASMQVFVVDQNMVAVFRDAEWQFFAEVGSPSGGQVVDQEARTAIDSILTILQTSGILPPQG